ncbi:hypothetical protein [Marinobacter zhejiangensis]|uniref:hypothetical protein n=1 Tax=Marinobacter zhejiangensis TaxID=488535 RepID=UPI000B825897|nr:hypothetical protein [Marinobacter zhejiangensis]
MKKSIEQLKKNNEDWRKVAIAFYSVAHGDLSDWKDLPDYLKKSEIGEVCQKYIDTKDSKYLEEAGQIIAGKNWYTALGRSF